MYVFCCIPTSYTVSAFSFSEYMYVYEACPESKDTEGLKHVQNF